MLSRSIALSVALFVSACLAAADDEPVSFNNIIGEYYYGDGTGVNCSLVLNEKETFSFRWQGCLGTYDTNYGGAIIKDGVLHLTPQKTNVQEGFRGTLTEFYPVRWKARLYLIATNDIIEFCSDVNQRSEPRRETLGMHYLRKGDEKKRVTEKPAVPNQWDRFILAKPVNGRITELIGKQEGWLDKGAADGLLEGMILTAREHGEIMFSKVLVVSVEKNRCRIQCDWKDSELALGQKISSRFQD